MSIFRIRWAFNDGAWRVVSARRTNAFATTAVDTVVYSKGRQYLYLPVLSNEPAPPTPYVGLQGYLWSLPEEEKSRRAALLRDLRRMAAPADVPLPELDFA